ncbi:MAG: hypothetical protein R2748_20725 [Bryobacterales bacterium]
MAAGSFPDQRQTPATLTVTVDASGAHQTVRRGRRTSSCSAGGEQQVVKVRLTVTQPMEGPRIEAAPSALSFNAGRVWRAQYKS